MTIDLDLSAVRADDALLDMIGGRTSRAHLPPGDPAVRALLDWRRQTLSAPITELVDVDLALDLIRRTDR